jgi:hypothetical protein
MSASLKKKARRVRRQLAFELTALGEEFFVYEDITTSTLPVRPTKKLSNDWTWEDCHRAFWWGLAKRKHDPGHGVPGRDSVPRGRPVGLSAGGGGPARARRDRRRGLTHPDAKGALMLTERNRLVFEAAVRLMAAGSTARMP